MKNIVFGIALILMGNYLIDLSQEFVLREIELLGLGLPMMGLVMAVIGLCEKNK